MTTPLIASFSASIDEEHLQLNQLLESLRSKLCDDGLRTDCSACSPERRSYCSAVFLDHFTDIIAFMIDHFAHEERLMAMLEQTGEVQAHCLMHKRAHAEIAQSLSECVYRLDESNPIASARELQHLVRLWLDEHLLACDRHFLKLLSGPSSETPETPFRITRLHPSA